MNLDKLKASLKLHEGIKALPYQDHLGHWTVGVGHLMTRPLPIPVIDLLLQHDIEDCIFDLDREHHGWRAHSSNRQNVLVEMCFNMGAPRLATFVRMWEALERRDYDAAADEMLDSKWCDQVGERAETLSLQMRRG